jgi:hypothetical protein
MWLSPRKSTALPVVPGITRSSASSQSRYASEIARISGTDADCGANWACNASTPATARAVIDAARPGTAMRWIDRRGEKRIFFSISA